MRANDSSTVSVLRLTQFPLHKTLNPRQRNTSLDFYYKNTFQGMYRFHERFKMIYSSDRIPLKLDVRNEHWVSP